MYYFYKIQREQLLQKFSLILMALKLISVRMMNLLPILNIFEPMRSLWNAVASINPTSTVKLGANFFTSVSFSWSKDILPILIKIVLSYTPLLIVILCILRTRKVKENVSEQML